MNINLILFEIMSYLLKSAVVVFMFLNLGYSAPAPQTLYSNFVADLQTNHCTLPSSISIPNFPNKTAESSLQVCNSNEYLKYNKEVAILCTETFDLFKNIFCSENSRPDNVEFTFSQNVCKDLEGYAAVLPEGPLKHLVDHFTCPLLCSEDVQEACQVLWNSLLLTQSERSSTTKVQLPSENTDIVEKSSKEENNPDNDPKLTASSIKLVSESKDSEPKPNDPAITTIIKDTNEKTPESERNPDITHNNYDEDSHKSAANTKAVSEVEKYTVSKAIAEQSPVTANKKLGTSANSSNSKTLSLATDPQNVNSASLDLEKPQNQPSDHSNTPAIPTNTSGTIVTLQDLPEQKTDPEPTVQQKEKTQEATTPERPKNEPSPSAVANENPIEDVKSPQTLPTTGMKKEESKEAVHTPEAKQTNFKSDQLSEVSESSLSSEPSVVSVPAQKDASSSPASPTPSLEKMDEIPMPNEKDTDQYTDLENGDGDLDGEYSKQEYGDNGMYEPSKTKEPVSESPKGVVVPKEPVVSQRDELMDFNRNPSRDSYGRGSEEIQVLATFPSQEDGHFFFYLLTIVLIFMAGYLVFHNKQKIIALIVEGRHERRRRSHGLGYRKLETK